MADYLGKGRTNTFRVKDITALKEALHGDFTVTEEPASGDDAVWIDSIQTQSGDWTGWIDDENGDPIEVFVPDMIAEHLAEGEVAVFLHVGSEKLRYLGGYSVAVHFDGRQINLNIDEIYERAEAEFGVTGIARD